MERSLSAFQAWLEDNSVCPNYDLIEFRVVDASWGVFAKKEIPQGSSLGWIPHSAILSAQNTEIADLFEKEELTGGLALVIATAYEQCRKQDSKWAGYFASMPEREYLPVFWSEKELNCLKGTDLLDRVYQDRQFMEEDFETHVVPMMEKYKERFKDAPLKPEDFHNSASLVSSRAFFVDKDHGQSMVPFADVFNHKCAVVAIDRDHAVEQEDSSTEEEQEDSSTLVDAASLSPEERLEITICSSCVDGQKGLEIRAAQTIPEGHEVHNTYGELSNEELLNKYGFCVMGNPFDCVTLEKELILDELSKAVSSSITFKDRRRLLQHAEETLEADTLWNNCRIFPDARTTQSVLMILQFFLDEEKNRRLARRIASWTPELLSEIIDISQQQEEQQEPKMSDRSWICLRSLLTHKLELLNRYPAKCDMIESVRLWHQNTRFILNEFIKCMDINISVFQGLQLSANVSPSWMMIASEEQQQTTKNTRDTQAPLFIRKRKCHVLSYVMDNEHTGAFSSSSSSSLKDVSQISDGLFK